MINNVQWVTKKWRPKKWRIFEKFSKFWKNIHAQNPWFDDRPSRLLKINVRKCWFLGPKIFRKNVQKVAHFYEFSGTKNASLFGYPLYFDLKIAKKKSYTQCKIRQNLHFKKSTFFNENFEKIRLVNFFRWNFEFSKTKNVIRIMIT